MSLIISLTPTRNSGVNYARILHFPMNLNCPKCQSDQIQAFRMAYERGTSTSKSASSGVGVGLGTGGVGLGVGGGTTTTTSMSITAQRVAPPQKKKLFWPIILGFIGFVSFNSAMLGKSAGPTVFALILCGASIYMIYTRVSFNRNTLPKLYANWEKSWLCHKCGNDFILD